MNPGKAVFQATLKLHYSQTATQVDLNPYEFQATLKLHYSQTHFGIDNRLYYVLG